MTDWLTYAAYRVGAGLVGVLPEFVIRRLGEFGGRLSWIWAKGRRDMAVRHMRRVLGPNADHEGRGACHVWCLRAVLGRDVLVSAP